MLKKEANFDPLAYFEQLAGKNRLCKSKGFVPVFCSGWFTKSVYTVWVLAGVRYNDPDSRKESMALCRKIFKQFLSRMIRDKAKMVYGQAMYYLNLDKVLYKELGRYSFNGATGLYFMIENDLPEDLRYDEDEWDE